MSVGFYAYDFGDGIYCTFTNKYTYESILVYLESSVTAIEPNFSSVCENITDYDEKHIANLYGLGKGWMLGFSSIENYRAATMGSTLFQDRKRLITSDGRRFEISEDLSGFEDHELGDMTFSDSGGNYTGASYTVTYKDGKKEYFDSAGRNIAIMDRFGNTITLSYTQSSGKTASITITDTLGNVVVYTNTLMNQIAYFTDQFGGSTAYNIEWTLSLNGVLQATYYSYYYNNPNSNFNQYRHIGKKDACNELTTYYANEYSAKYNGFVSSSHTNNGIKRIDGLYSITLPNKSSICLGNKCSNMIERLGTTGYQEIIRLEIRSNDIPIRPIGTGLPSTLGFEYIKYEYGDYSGLLPGREKTDYSTTVTKKQIKNSDTANRGYYWETQKNIYKFNHSEDYSFHFLYDYPEHGKISETEYTWPDIRYDWINDTTFYTLGATGSTYIPHKTKETLFTYNMNSPSTSDLPTGITVKQYDLNTATLGMSQTYAYTYDSKGNVLSETKPNGQTITTAYDSTYSMPLTITYKKDAGTTVVISNSRTTDLKSIASTVTSVNNTLSSKSEYTYDTYGRISTEKSYTDSTNYITTQYNYGSSNAQTAKPIETRITGVKDTAGTLVSGSPGYAAGTVVTKYSYNDKGLATSQTDASGNISELQYDAIGRITQVKNPDNSTTSYVYALTASHYSNYGRYVTYTNELGISVKNVYFRTGKLAEVYDVLTNKMLSSYTYDSYNQLLTETIYSDNSDDLTTYYHYDNRGRILEKTTKKANGTITSQETYAYTYTSGQLKTTKTILGDTNSPSIVTTTYIDNMGNTVKTGRKLGSTENIDTYTYDYLGNMLTEKTAYTTSLGGSVTNTYTYDYAGRILTSKNASNQTSSSTYDWLGRKLSSTDYSSKTANYAYDNLGRLLQTSTPFSTAGSTTYYSKTQYSYDQNGNVTSERMTNNLPGAADAWTRTDYAYNNRNMLTKVTSYDGANASGYTQYWYDAGGNVLRMYTGLSSPLTITDLDTVSGSDTDYSVTAYEYDRFGNVKKLTDALGQSESYTYDINGNMLTKTDRNGVAAEYTYDNLGRVTLMAAGDEEVATTYTLTGLVRTVSNDTATSTYTYDSLGRVIKEVTGNQTKQYTYDLADNRKTYTLTVGGISRFNTSYTYDALARLTNTSEDGITSAYTYDTNGNRASVTYNNGLSETYAYNLANLVTSVTNKKGSTTLSSFAYTYNLDGNQKTKTDNTGKTTTYLYDGLGRLTSESESTGQAYAYEYDDSGNRKKLTATGTDAFVTTYTYDLNNRLREESKAESTGTQVTSYTYDPNGNQLGAVKSLLKASGEEFMLGLANGLASAELRTYNELNLLTGVWTDSGTASYTYYPNGLRASKTIGGVTTVFVLDGGDVVLETQNNSVTAKYIRAMNLIHSSIGGTVSYYLYNAHGDVVQLANAAGAVAKSYIYDAFGVEKDPDSNDVNPFRYCGEYFDLETNTYYLRARSYNPATGRFLSADTVIGVAHKMPNGQELPDPLSLNLYTYCGNNPIMYQDPSGHFWETVLDACSIIWSAADMINNPSWVNLGFLLWDIGAAVIPFIPGSYTAKGGKLLIKTAGKADDVVDAFKALSKADRLASAGGGNLIMGYKNLKKIVKGLGLEVHHLLEKRFAKTLGLNADDILSIAIDKDLHKQITKLMREKIGYAYDWSKVLRTGTASAQDIWKAIVDTYTELNMTEYLPAIKEQLIESANHVGEITDWLGW